MTTPQTVAPPVTLEELAGLPTHPRYELVKGVLVEQMTASLEHEETVSIVNWHLYGHVTANRLGRVYGSNVGYVTGPDSPATCRLADVSFISNARLGGSLLAGMLYDGGPDLAVEVLSESNTPGEIGQKIAEYLNAGGRAVWVVDIDGRTLTVYTVDGPPVVLTDGDSVDGGDYLPGFSCPVASLLPGYGG